MGVGRGEGTHLEHLVQRPERPFHAWLELDEQDAARGDGVLVAHDGVGEAGYGAFVYTEFRTVSQSHCVW